MSGQDFEKGPGYGASFEKITESLSARKYMTLQSGDSVIFTDSSGKLIAAVVMVRVHDDGSAVLQVRSSGGELAPFNQ